MTRVTCRLRLSSEEGDSYILPKSLEEKRATAIIIKKERKQLSCQSFSFITFKERSPYFLSI